MKVCKIKVSGKDGGVIGRLTLNGKDYDGVTLESVRAQYKPDASEIILYIDSIGGDVEEGEKIAKFLKSTGKKITTVVTGKCYSIATLLFLIPEDPDLRQISPTAQLMIHSPFLTSFNCDVYRCDAGTLEYVAGEVKKTEDFLLDLYENKTGLARDTLKKLLARETYMSASEAIRFGFAGKKFVKKNMGKEGKKNEGLLHKLNSLKKAILNAFSVVIANIELSLEDGTMVYVESEDEEFAGKPGFFAESGQPLPAGEHKLKDGRVMRVGEAGIIESVSEVGAMEGEAEKVIDESAMEEEVEIESMKKEEKEMTAMDETAIQNLVTEAGKLLEKLSNANDLAEAKKIEAKLDLVNSKIASIERFMNIKQKQEEIRSKYPEKNGTPHATVGNARALNSRDDVFRQIGLHALSRRDARDREGRLVVADVNVLSPRLDYTYNGKEDVNELFYKPTIFTPDMKKIFTVKQDVKSKQQLFRVLPFSNTDLLRKAQECNPVARDITDAVIDNRTLETFDVGDELSQCYTAFQDIIFEKWLETGPEIGNLTGTMVEKVILTLLQDGLRRAFFRILNFGDQNSASVAYNMITGILPKLIQGLAEYDPSDTGSNYCVSRVDTITALNNNATTNAEYYLRRLQENAPNLLRSMPIQDRVFLVTQNVYDNYLTQIENRTATEGAFKLLQDGTKALFFRGIEVVPILMWDELLRFGSAPLGTTANTLVLYTTPKNHVIGLDRNNDEHRVEVWYDKRDDLLRTRMKFKLGYEYVQCDLQALSYGKI